MKRLVRYQLNFHSRWLTLSGVMMGVAFFLLAFDFFALRQLHEEPVLDLILFLILPMVLQAAWCVPLRSERWKIAEPHGVIAAAMCLVLLGQAIAYGGVFTIVMAAVFTILGGAAAVLITWGFIPHKALGMLVFAGTAVVRALIFTLPQYLSNGYMVLVQELPPLCMIIGIMVLFGGIRIADDA